LSLSSPTVPSIAATVALRGFRGRDRHHLAPVEHIEAKWQVDSLRLVCSVEEIWYTASPYRWECPWARCMLTLPGAQVPAPKKFGATGCEGKCVTHLPFFAEKPSLESFRSEVSKLSPSGCRVERLVVSRATRSAGPATRHPHRHDEESRAASPGNTWEEAIVTTTRPGRRVTTAAVIEVTVTRRSSRQRGRAAGASEGVLGEVRRTLGTHAAPPSPSRPHLEQHRRLAPEADILRPLSCLERNGQLSFPRLRTGDPHSPILDLVAP
jgi:Uri superfamily endonuclease